MIQAMKKAFYERLQTEYADNSDVALSPADAFAALVTGRSVCAAVLFREKELLLSNNAPQEGHDVCPAVFIQARKDGAGVLVTLGLTFEYWGLKFEASRSAQLQRNDAGAWSFQDAAVRDGQVVANHLAREPFEFHLPGLGAPLSVRINIAPAELLSMVNAAWTVPLRTVLSLPPTNVEPFKNMPQRLCTLLALYVLHEQNPTDMLNTFLSTALNWELRRNADMYAAAAGALFTLLTNDAACALSDQCTNFVTVVNALTDEQLLAPATPAAASAAWPVAVFEAAGGNFNKTAEQVWPEATRLVRFFRFLVASLKSDNDHPIYKFLKNNRPADMVKWPINVIDGGLDLGVHAEMRFLHLHRDEIVAPANRAAFGIGRLCCGHCFVYLRSNGMTNIGSHGKCYRWSFPPAASHLGNLALPSNAPDDVEAMHDLIATTDSHHQTLSAELDAQGIAIVTRDQYGLICL
eukprot:m.327192 g.327192  ORF g.327192 m.327192 type:complete len:464 (+) comp48327_c0_seq1:106-1497(+)